MKKRALCKSVSPALHLGAFVFSALTADQRARWRFEFKPTAKLPAASAAAGRLIPR
jgi:hypothetical protein